MKDLQKHKARMALLRKSKERAHLKPVATTSVQSRFLSGEVDTAFLERSNVADAYSKRIDNFDLSTTKEEALALIDSIDDGNTMDHVLEPVFLSLLDGTMRAFKIGTKQGITASRLYSECKSFNYSAPSKSSMLDSYTEHLNERESISDFDGLSSYSDGELSRSGVNTNMRDASKMKKAKKDHFDGANTAPDAFDENNDVFVYPGLAKSKGVKEQRAEVDHLIPCAEICNKLKKNKALTDQDIKDITNTEGNLAVTSMKHNRGAKTGKFDKSRDTLQQEAEQGFVTDAKGKVHKLSDEERKARETMVERMDTAQKEIDFQTNRKVIDNLTGDRNVQMRLSKDAAGAAASQSIGDLIIFMIKPLYYELSDCFKNGIEAGVSASSFKAALSFRLNRMKTYVIEQAGSLLKDGFFGFFKSFLSMLLEGIVNCFVGVFKSVARMVKEGLKVLMQIVPVLRDSTKTMAEKGDAIIKLIAGSLTIFASLGIESWLNSLGIGEPWSIIVTSVLSAVLTAVVMYLLDKIDLFGVGRELKLRRISEVLELKVQDSKDEIRSMVKAYT